MGRSEVAAKVDDEIAVARKIARQGTKPRRRRWSFKGRRAAEGRDRTGRGQGDGVAVDRSVHRAPIRLEQAPSPAAHSALTTSVARPKKPENPRRRLCRQQVQAEER